MANERVAFYMLHPRRSKEAFTALIDDWEGILVSDGYGCTKAGYKRAKPAGASHPQRTGLAVTIPTSRPVGRGRWRSCNVCVIWPPPHPRVGSGGRGARVCKLIDQYHDRRTMRAGWCAACSGRWTRSGCFCPTTASSRPTTGRSGPCALGSSKRSLGTASKGIGGGAHLVPERDVSVAIGVDLSRPRGGRGPFLHGAAAPTRLGSAHPLTFKAVITPDVDAQEEPYDAHTETFPPTDRSVPSRAVVKKSTPVGRECALVPPAASGQALELSYWDLWFALVADADFEGSWERFVEHLRLQKNQGGSSRLAERKLSHLRELERRLWQADDDQCDCGAGRSVARRVTTGSQPDPHTRTA